MSIIGTLPVTLTNGTTADATQVMSNFNYIVSQANSNAAHSGANSDITSITGLATPLATNQGGTGNATTPAGLLTLGMTLLAGPTSINGFHTTRASNTTITCSAGAATDSTAVQLVYSSQQTLNLAVTGLNGLDIGVLVNTTWYHIFVISKADGTAGGFTASLSATVPALPATYTLYRRIGSFLTDGAAHVIGYSQLGNQFLWLAPVNNVNGTPADTNAHAFTVTTPTGIQCIALVDASLLRGAGDVGVWLSAQDQTDTAASAVTGISLAVGATLGTYNAGAFQIRTDTSAQIRYRSNAASGTLTVNTEGWIDLRGVT